MGEDAWFSRLSNIVLGLENWSAQFDPRVIFHARVSLCNIIQRKIQGEGMCADGIFPGNCCVRMGGKLVHSEEVPLLAIHHFV
jgi:hypothetical protein